MPVNSSPVTSVRRSYLYPLDLIEGDLVAGAVIEFGGAGGLMGGDGLGVFEGARAGLHGMRFELRGPIR